MKKTFVDVLLELPVDTTLQTFLAANGLTLPDDLSWSDGQEVTQTVIEAIRSWPDEIARDQLIAKLMASVGLGDAAGKQAMFQVAQKDGSALMGLVASHAITATFTGDASLRRRPRRFRWWLELSGFRTPCSNCNWF